MQRGDGSIPGQGTKIPHASQPKRQKQTNRKTQNKMNIVTNSIKTLKMVHMKKILEKGQDIAPLNSGYIVRENSIRSTSFKIKLSSFQ